jgi:hypothetical protein
MYRKIARLGVLGLLIWATTVVPASAAAPTWTVTQLTTVNEAPYYCGVSGDRVVWQATAGSPRRLWTWKMGSAPSCVATAVMWTAPKVSGDRIAWICSGGGLPFGVYTWKAGEAAPTLVWTSTSHVPSDLQISGDRLVWSVSDTWEHVVTWKVGDGSQITTLNVGTYQGGSPQVSGDRVVWYESDGDRYQIATWKLGEGASRFITSGTLSNDDPAVSGDRIAWLHETGVGDEWAILTQVASETVPTTVVVNPTYFSEGPVISGDRIAWRQIPESDVHYQVFTWHVGDMSAAQISAGDSSQSYVDLSGDRLAWVNVDKVMTWWAGDAAPSVVATGVGPWDTRVSGDRIAWLNNGQVMTAVLRTATKLGTPTLSPTKPTHNKHAHFSAVLTPGAASMAAGCTKTLTLYQKLSRYVIVRGKRVKQYYWKLRNTVKMTGSGAGATQKFSATATPKYAGSWKAVVTYGAGTGYLGCTSPTKPFTVK